MPFKDEGPKTVRSFAVINQKGGCGKTTTSINLAAAFAMLDQRVLLVDLDPQSHCALGLAVPENQIDLHVGEALLNPEAKYEPGELTWQISGRLDLLPSTVALAGVERKLAPAPDRDLRLTKLLRRQGDRYDLCIIDCPPSIGLLTFNALRAADEVLIPVETSYFALKGAAKQLATIRVMAEQCGHAVHTHVLASMYDVRLRMARELMDELHKQFGAAVLPVPIHFNTKLKEAVSFGQPIVEYDPACRAAQDYERLARHLLAHVPVKAAALPAVTEMHDNRDALAAAADALGALRDRPKRADPTDHSTQAPSPAPPPTETPPARPTDRAAELVQRARALAARANRLEERFAVDADLTDAVERAQTPRGGRHAKLTEKLRRLYGVRQTAQGTLFVQPLNGARRLAVVGDFNDWSPAATPFKRNEQLNVWEACVPLKPGKYHYRLVADEKWMNDPHNRRTESNPFGQVNNVVEVG